MTKVTLISIVASFAALAEAVQLTNDDYTLTPGEAFTISWSDAQGPVSLTLKTGPSDALTTVEEITSGQTGESFVWNVPTNLPSDQYAIEIRDTAGEPNYSPQFALSGDGSQSVVPTSGGAVSVTSAASVESVSQPSVVSSASAATTEASAVTETSAQETVASESSVESSIHFSSGNATQHETTESERPTQTRGVQTETETEEPSATETEGGETQVPDNGAAGRSGALFGLLAAFALIA